MKLTHVDGGGRARMVDVAAKPETARMAVAEGVIRMSSEAFAALERGDAPKGDVIGTAELAGVMGAKRTGDLIPLCHPLGLDHVDVTAALDASLPGVRVRATTTAVAKTGVEMEALSAVTISLLAVYDMAKAIDRGMEIGPVRLLKKTGGTRGDWQRDAV